MGVGSGQKQLGKTDLFELGDVLRRDDPAPEQEIHDDDQATIGGYTPYAGMQVKGQVRDTIVRGQVVVRNGELAGTAGWGKYIPALTIT